MGGDNEISNRELSKKLGVFNQIKMIGLISETDILRKIYSTLMQ